MKHINRKQLNTQLKKMLQLPFIYAYGVEESGKETAIKNYLKNDKQVNYQWIRLIGEQNKEVLWNKVHSKIKDRCGLPDDMGEYPQTDVEKKEYAEHFFWDETPFVLVFQGGGEKDVNALLDLYWELTAHGRNMLKVIFVNTKIPGRKIDKLVQKGYCSILSQAAFLFLPEEISAFYKNQKQEFTEQDIMSCMKISGGWIAMLNKVAIQEMPYVPINQIRSLMDTILIENFSPKQLSSLMKISFLKTFELDQAFYLTKDKGLMSKITSLAQGNLMFQEAEGFESYRILPPFRKLLLQKLNASRINRQELNRSHLQWLMQKEKYMDALEYSHEIHDIEMELTILSKYPDPMYYDLNPNLITAIYAEIPEQEMIKYIYVYMQAMGDYLLTIDPQKGAAMLENLMEYIETHDIETDKNAVKGEMELFLGYASYNNLYDMSEHFKKAYHYLYPNVSKISKQSMVVSFGSPHVLYQYLNTPGDCQHLISFMEKEIQYYTSITQGLNTAIDIQSRAEYELETGHYHNARMLAEKAYHEAFAFNIKSMCVCSMFTIGRASILSHDETNYAKVIRLMHIEQELSHNVFLNKEIESALAYLMALQMDKYNLPKDVLDPNIEIEVMDAQHHSFSYIAQGQIYIRKKRFDKLYTLSQKMQLHYHENSQVFGHIYYHLYASIALYQMGKQKDALYHMQEAINYSIPDQFTTPFTEQGVVAKEILEQLPQTAHIKKIIQQIETYTQFKVFHFNEKEVQVFMLHKKGYTRAQIADEMHMTIYAVKYYLQNIKRKTSSREAPELFRG